MPKPNKLSATERALAKATPADRAIRAVKDIMPKGTWIAVVTVEPQTGLTLRADAPQALAVHNMLMNAAEMVSADAKAYVMNQEALKAAGAVPQ